MKKELKDQLKDESIILEPQSCFNLAIVRVDNYRLVYSYSLIVDALMIYDSITESEAIEFIEYNTIRSLPYMGEYSPIIECD